MIILPGNSVRATGYDVANSSRFNSGSSDNLSISLSSTATNTKKGTLSFWFKTLGTNQQYPIAKSAGTIFYLYFNSSSQLVWQNGSTNTRITNQVFRDPNSWGNLVVNFDTTQATASNRQKMFYNGTEITSFGTSNDLTLNQVISIFDGDSNARQISGYTGGGYYSGYICEVVGIDGEQLDPTSFGEFDEDSPNIWKPKDVSGLTFGNNGFYLDFEDSSALGNDVSGNNNDFTVNNLTAADQSIDTCTNNWSNLNAIDNINSVLSEGNLRTTGTSNWSKVNSTFSMPNGSWYVEIYSKVGSGNGNSGIGIKRVESPTAATLLGYESTSYGYLSNGNIYNNNGVITGSLATWSAGDIMSMSFTGSVLKFYKNNSLIHTISSLTGEYMFSFGSYPSDSYIVNFGQDGTFSGEVTAQGNSDPNGYGNFYYSPGSFYALNTKNLAEFG